MTSLVNAANAAANVKVFVTTVSVRQRKAHAPTGNGPRIRPEIVVRKMAKSCHALVESWWGFGTAKRKSMPINMDMASGIGFAPFHGGREMRRRWRLVLEVGEVLEGRGELGVDINYLSRDLIQNFTRNVDVAEGMIPYVRVI